MSKRILTLLAAAGIMSFVMIGSAAAQSGDDGKMSSSQMAGNGSAKAHMSHQEAMDKLPNMSTDEKAAMYDKTTQKQKMSAMKMSGKGMSHEGMMGGMGKSSDMSNQEKADMFDKMPMAAKMSAMTGSSGHHSSKSMGNME